MKWNVKIRCEIDTHKAAQVKIALLVRVLLLLSMSCMKRKIGAISPLYNFIVIRPMSCGPI